MLDKKVIREHQICCEIGEETDTETFSLLCEACGEDAELQNYSHKTTSVGCSEARKNRMERYEVSNGSYFI